MRKKEFVFRIIVSVFSALMIFIGLELMSVIYVGITREELPKYKEEFFDNSFRLFEFDRDLGFRLKPNFSDNEIKVNNLGFRDGKDFYLTGDDARKRVLLLGDSMVFGMGIEQNKIFSEILNKELPEYIFINTGVIGYDTVQEYLVLKKYIDIIKPKIVILFFTESNDMLANVRGDNFYPKGWIRDRKLNIDHVPLRSFVPWYKKLTFYRLLDKNLLKGKDALYYFHRISFILFGERSSAWKVTRLTLHEIGNLCRQHNIPLIIIDIPSRGQLDNNFFSRFHKNILHKTCSEEGFLYYDLRNYYPAQYRELFLPNRHFNEKGHRFIASLIMKILHNSDEFLGNE